MFSKLKYEVRNAYSATRDIYRERIALKQAREIRASELNTFDDVRYFCVFVGQPRSGHSLVGALLNAHPNIVIAHERDILRYIDRGLDRSMLFSILLQRDRWFVNEQGGEWTGYSYSVPNQHQGRYEQIRVIGDKKGGETATKLFADPSYIDRLYDVVQTPFKIINHVRNPYDCISTQWRKMQSRPWVKDKSLELQIEKFFQRTEGISSVRNGRFADVVFDTWHEDFVESPKVVLKNLINFLGEEPPGGYLDDCASILFDRPQKTRIDAPWTDALVRQVAEESAKYDFLRSYKWD